MHGNLDPVEFANLINTNMNLPTPSLQKGDYFGFGCRWCKDEMMWITIIPLEKKRIAILIIDLFQFAGCTTEIIENEFELRIETRKLN